MINSTFRCPYSGCKFDSALYIFCISKLCIYAKNIFALLNLLDLNLPSWPFEWYHLIRCNVNPWKKYVLAEIEIGKIVLLGMTICLFFQYVQIELHWTTNGGHMTDIKCRIAETKMAFADMKNILANLKMPFDLRYRILNCYVMPILLYGCENWILNQQQIKRLEATEMWFIRRMQKISWKEKKTNEQVLRETIGKRKLIQKIVQRQVTFFGHVMRKGQLENIVTTAKINGKRKRGKPSIQYMDQIKKWTQQDSIESLMSKIYERTLLVAQVYWQGTQRRRRRRCTNLN